MQREGNSEKESPLSVSLPKGERKLGKQTPFALEHGEFFAKQVGIGVGQPVVVGFAGHVGNGAIQGLVAVTGQ